MNRRQVLKTSIAAAALSAAAPRLLVPSARAADPLKVGVLIPISGPAGLFGPSSRNCSHACGRRDQRGGRDPRTDRRAGVRGRRRPPGRCHQGGPQALEGRGRRGVHRHARQRRAGGADQSLQGAGPLRLHPRLRGRGVLGGDIRARGDPDPAARAGHPVDRVRPGREPVVPHRQRLQLAARYQRRREGLHRGGGRHGRRRGVPPVHGRQLRLEPRQDQGDGGGRGPHHPRRRRVGRLQPGVRELRPSRSGAPALGP